MSRFDLSTPDGRYRARKAGLDVPVMKRGPAPADPWTRFCKFVSMSDAGACWEWQGARDPAGYGRFYREPGKASLAHRFAYELLRGEIPEEKQLDHLCRNRACVNPDHLEPVTSRENTMRGENQTAKNAAKTACPRGHEYSKENTARWKNHRYCLACRIEWDKTRPCGWERQRCKNASSGSRESSLV